MMSGQDSNDLKKKIAELEIQLRAKEREVSIYQKELLKFSQNLDLILGTADRDIKALNQLHKSIVPTELPQFPGFEISRKFTYGTKQGGDYFDIFPHDDKMKFGILLASSSGYAMSAAFLSVVLQNSHILEAKKETSISETVQVLATQLQKIAEDKSETQLFYAVIDRRHMKMNFVCMGKIMGLIQATHESYPDSLKIISSESGGIAPGRKLDCSSLEVDLKPGYRICLVSEGLINTLNEEELVAAAEQTSRGGVHELRNQMFIQSQLKTGLEQPAKDQTVIVIEVKDNIVKLAKG